MNTTIKNIFLRTLLYTILSLAWVGVKAQGYGQYMNAYTTTYSITWDPYWNATTTNHSILHKDAKWYEFRKDYLTDKQKEADTFDDDNPRTKTLDGLVELQSTNEYVDTIYMHKGTAMDIYFPYLNLANGLDVSTYHYQRWFDYRTDGNYYSNLSTNSGTVYDLLTPANSWFYTNSCTAYRFQNGYVAIAPSSDNSQNLYWMNFYYPTDDEFSEINKEGDFKQTDNNYYVVACDVSVYNDTYYEFVSGGHVFGNGDYEGTDDTYREFWEPTLAGRAVFYIIGVEDEEMVVPEEFRHFFDAMADDKYTGGGNTGDEKYLEEYEITYPSLRTSNYTNELVALSKDASSYALPYVTDDNDVKTLNLAIAENDNTAGIVLSENTLEGENRVIQFYADGQSEGGSWKVENNSTATILVTKVVGGTTYNIARYHLTFKDNAIPLTQTQIDVLANPEEYTDYESCWWKDMTYRTPNYLNSNYDLITSLMFDYDKNLAANNTTPDGGQKAFYPFPMEWGTTSYAFYDGSNTADVESSSDTAYGADGTNISVYTRYGMYSITNEYIGWGDNNNNTNRPSEKPAGTDDFWFYVDASDRPGQVAELKFEENLCKGSEIVGTALIKSAGSGKNDDAGVMLTIMGVTTNLDGTETHTPIYRQCSSQIENTGFITSTVGETDLSSSLTGKGSGTNEWFQLYFSFVNTSEEIYDHYTLRIDNYCASTQGGDYYFDAVQLYILHPNVDVVQTSLICAEESDKIDVRIDVDYSSIMSRLGYEYTDYLSEEPIETIDDELLYFIIINETKYNNYINENPDGLSDDELKAEAIKNSIVTFYTSENDEDEQGVQLPMLKFNPYYYKNEKYDVDKVGENTPTNYTGDGSFYYRENSDYGYCLSIDCYTDMAAYTPYLIILEPHNEADDDDDDEKYEEYAKLIGTQCAIETEYYISSSTILKVNGEIVDPTLTYCIGQTVNVSAVLQYTNSQGEIVPLNDDVYFDWFFGDKNEYISVNEEFKDDTYTDGVSLYTALLAFREVYPDADELNSTTTPAIGAFTQACYDIIKFYLTKQRSDELNNTLILHKTHLEISILSTGIEIVCQPIPITLVDENGEQIELCCGYVPLTLQASGEAPSLNLGFENVEYPNEEFVPSVRLGMNQILSATSTSSNSSPSQITINLRGAQYIADDGSSNEVDHLGIIENLSYLYLIETNDPKYFDILNDSTFSYTSYPIGQIESLQAKEKIPSGEEDEWNLMNISFFGEDSEESSDEYYKAFEAKEGYYYVLNVNFEEKDEEDESIETPCQGTFPLDLIVVPEYLVWIGDSTSNWNNDNHWRRADKNELNKPETDAYPTNEDNTTDNGYVPMLFSKVIMPRDSKAELYMAGFEENTDEMLSWKGDEDTTDHGGVNETPTPLDIMYDMMIYDTKDEQGELVSMKTEHYRVNLCDEIHFEPGAELLYSEQLIYNKAWTDVELTQEPWTLKSTPLMDVVSGDWYTKKETGRETQEYFTDITFNLDSCDRLSPMVYQRSWSNSGNQIIYNNEIDNKTVPAYASTGWSSVYNDANVNYQAGEGFSIKASNGKEDKLMFRFPKADQDYQYQEGTSSSMTDATTTISRGNSGQLLISGLVSRTDPDKDDDNVYSSGEVTVDLTQTNNSYYIIGNPFTASMSMEKFLAENEQFKGYWLESTYGPIAGTSDGTSWGTADCLVEPYSAFFVTMDDTDLTRADDPTTITFTKDMQTLEEEDEVSKTSFVAFSVRATSNVGTTAASLSYSKEAIDGYNIAEDAVLMEDATWKKDGMPLVYTVAGDMAVSVNKLNALTLIPLGCFADDDLEYTLTFVGVENLNEPSLYDAYTNTDTPITEGYSLKMEGSSHGRYFIRSNGSSSTGIKEIEEASSSMMVYSPTKGAIIVSAEAGIETLEVYSLGGILLGKANVGGNITCTLDGIESGIAIVRARTLNGTFVKKIRVK